MKIGKAMSGLYKSYLFTMVAKEAAKLADIDVKKQARKLVNSIDFDKASMLRKVGLQPYTPAKATFGTGLVLLVGAAIGVVAGLAFAPARGEEFRRNIKERANSWMAEKPLAETQPPATA